MKSMFPLIEVFQHTSAHARGAACGRAAARQIQHSVATYAQLFAFCGIDWATARQRAMRYLSVINALNPALVDEMQGLAEGSSQSFDAILALNCRTEILPSSYLNGEPQLAGNALAANRAAGIEDWSECTAMAVTAAASADGSAWLAQNWDWIGRQREALVVLKTIDDAGQRITTLTEAGMLAKIGFNESGFALGLNIVRSLRDGESAGVPVHVLLRHLLSCRSVAHARESLATLSVIGFGAASNVPCADASGEVACFEVAPAGWAEQRPVNGVVVHTNHFLCESLLGQQAAMGAFLSSPSRLATAQRHAAQPAIGLPQLEAFLRDQSDGYLSICRGPNPDLPAHGRVESVAGIIINTRQKRMWIAPDVPNQVEFEPIP